MAPGLELLGHHRTGATGVSHHTELVCIGINPDQRTVRLIHLSLGRDKPAGGCGWGEFLFGLCSTPPLLK
jgi:hypothetical protein